MTPSPALKTAQLVSAEKWGAWADPCILLVHGLLPAVTTKLSIISIYWLNVTKVKRQ